MEPLISCIMPTADRPRFVAKAIEYFQRQTHTARELIILDDGLESAEPVAAGEAGVRYVRLPERMDLGAKRNLGCELAEGEIIAHWDDDDWIGPDRLSRQYTALQSTGAAACGAADLLYYAPLAGQAWRYARQRQDPPGLCGGTLVYRKAAWKQHAFPILGMGEDEAFVAQMPASALCSLPAEDFYIGVLHGRNTAPKSLRAPRWTPASLDNVAQRLGADRDFYARLRGAAPFVAPQRRNSLTLAAPFVVYDGYGSMAEYLALGLAREGVAMSCAPICVDMAGLTTEMQDLLTTPRQATAAEAVLYFSFPDAPLAQYSAARDLFIYTMWEGDALPPAWVAQLNAARAVLVPTRFLPGVMRSSGVTRPVEVVPQGIDPAIYRPIDRSGRDGITTLIVGTVTGRKHVLEGVEAWKQAFAGDSQARLIIKSRFRHGHYASDDPRIRFEDSNLTSRGIAGHYAEADVLLALGNEGFGLPVVEGMATGLPVVALNSEGQADICADAKGLVLPVPPSGRERADDNSFGPGGWRALPDVAAAARQLRWVAHHRAEAVAMGQAASEWARRHRNVWDMAPAVLDVLERCQTGTHPLAPSALLWVPSLGQRCGIAEYGIALTGALRRTALRQAPRDLRGIRHLHLEHEFGIVQDAAVHSAIHLARASRVPVSATFHTVLPTSASFEAELDGLVALTAAGQRRLAARNPGRLCRHIPHGCPTWFPPRKPRRGRTIGAFGFLGRHKGFFQLIDVARQLGNVEVLLFSHTADAALAAEFDAAAAGLPIRRIGSFLDNAEVARRLAAEADILAYWYDEAGHDYASGAITTGLASGVPVLASAVRCFDDLGEALYRPAAASFADGAAMLLEDTALRTHTAQAAREYCYSHDWPAMARRYRALWSELSS